MHKKEAHVEKGLLCDDKFLSCSHHTEVARYKHKTFAICAHSSILRISAGLYFRMLRQLWGLHYCVIIVRISIDVLGKAKLPFDPNFTLCVLGRTIASKNACLQSLHVGLLICVSAQRLTFHSVS